MGAVFFWNGLSVSFFFLARLARRGLFLSFFGEIGETWFLGNLLGAGIFLERRDCAMFAGRFAVRRLAVVLPPN